MSFPQGSLLQASLSSTSLYAPVPVPRIVVAGPSDSYSTLQQRRCSRPPGDLLRLQSLRDRARQPTLSVRPDSSALGDDHPRIMASAYVATTTRSQHSPDPLLLLDDDDRIDRHTPPSPVSTIFSTLSTKKGTLYTISSPIGRPFTPRPEDYGGYVFKKLPNRASALIPMTPDMLPAHNPHWLSRLRSALRLLIIVLSGAVVIMLVHTLEIYRGNKYLDLRNGELPMTWPAHTNLAPTLILFAIAAANFLASVAILTLSFTRSFRRPMRSRDIYRIVAGSFGVVLWVTALVVFNLLDKASKASLGRYACTNRKVMSNGRFQYRAVCEEQGVAFYLAIGAASAEVFTLITLAVSAIISAKSKAAPLAKSDEKKASMSLNRVH